MIYIKRVECPKVLDLSKGNSAASKEYVKVIEYFETKDRDYKFEAYSKGNVKKVLLEMFNNKCAYCESKVDPVSYGDIEHFRPKGAYHAKDGDALEYPGYYWLAMDWNNLLFACDVCNRSFKKNKFPLVNEALRKKAHDHIIIEEPLLIDPCNENDSPQDYIGFTVDGLIQYKDGEGNKGQTTIEVCGLFRANLTEARKAIAKDIEDKKTQALGYLKTIAILTNLPNTELYEDVIQSNFNDLESVYEALKKLNLPTSPYLAMVRDLTAEFLLNQGAQIEYLLTNYKQIMSRQSVGV